jgi:hypothetical protein
MTRSWRLRGELHTVAVLRIGLVFVLVILELTACGSVSATQRSIPAIQSQLQAPTTHPQVKVQKCGIVQGLESLKVPPSNTDTQQAENCFWHAFQHCLPAALVFITGSIDAGLSRTLTIHETNNTCFISDERQLRTGPHASSSATIYTCTDLVHTPNGLRFSACGDDGDVLVPGS